MKIAIATTENHIKADVEMHFGRTDWFCIYDNKKDSQHFLENPVRYDKEKAGCHVAEILIELGVDMVIAGRFGTRVSDLFREKNIQMVIPQRDMSVMKLIGTLKKLT